MSCITFHVARNDVTFFGHHSHEIGRLETRLCYLPVKTFVRSEDRRCCLSLAQLQEVIDTTAQGRKDDVVTRDKGFDRPIPRVRVESGCCHDEEIAGGLRL